jgi:hypothetical protein
VQFRANRRFNTSLIAATYKVNGGAAVAFAAPAGSYSTINANNVGAGNLASLRGAHADQRRCRW